MSAGIQLMRSTLFDDDIASLKRVPRWVPPRDLANAKYWHIPRTAALRSRGVVRLEFWCGLGRWVDLRTLTNKQPADNICGTCHGRALGFERGERLIFGPRNLFATPKLCPAIGVERADFPDYCAFCGGKRRWRRNYVHYDETQHVAGERLASFTPCTRHGWRWARLSKDETRIECRDWSGRACGFVFGERATIADLVGGKDE